MLLEAARNNRAYDKAFLNPDLELRDFCNEAKSHGEPTSFTHPGPTSVAFQESTDFIRALHAPEGAGIVGGGKVLKRVKGMGTVFDWRGTNWSQPNGGKINPLVFVQHIPVVPNMAGIADFVRLRDVLVAQGLMVHNSTDRAGNVALFAPMDRLCWQAKGANQQSCGTEHMHMTVGETWTKRQLRASAWLINLAKKKHGIPAHIGALGEGPGIVRVLKRGQVSHQRVSQAAGYNDRNDPGPGYDWEYVYHCVNYYRLHGETRGFEGA